MTPADIATIIAVLPPGYRASVTRSATGRLSVRVSKRTPGEVPDAASHAVDSVPSASVRIALTPEEAVRAVVADLGESAVMKLDDWRDRLAGISTRELERAAAEKVLTFGTMGRTRSNRARTVTAAEMLRYVQERALVVADARSASAAWRRILCIR